MIEAKSGLRRNRREAHLHKKTRLERLKRASDRKIEETIQPTKKPGEQLVFLDVKHANTNRQELDLILDAQIKKAIAAALPEEETNKREFERLHMVSQLLRQTLSKGEYAKKASSLLHNESCVHVDTPKTYRILLGRIKGLTGRQRGAIFKHELAHFKEAKNHGLRSRFQIQFFTHERGVGFSSSVQVNFPDDWTNEMLSKTIQSIAKAPATLSNLDQIMLSIPTSLKKAKIR